MGKKGDLLRQMKREQKMTVTRGWLEEHDKIVRDQAIRARAKEMESEAVKLARSIISEWESDDSGELNMQEIIRYMLAVTIKVLVDKFHWQTVSPGGKPEDMRYNIVRYAHYVDDELERLKNWGNIKEYSEKVISEYGIGFITEEVE